VGTYKVIQDIEAEDKLVGPFGLRQFIYLLIVAVSLFIMYRIGSIAWFLALPLIPHTLFFGLLALPFGGNQSTEVWLLAKIRFMIKPRKRVWDQTGLKELVTITVPKKMEKHLTKELTQTEVKSRLEALANTIDSRGWAIKNVDVNIFAQPSVAVATTAGSSDRLIDMSPVAAPPPGYTVTASDDMLDEQNNPTAQNLDRLISASSKAHREQLMAQMKQPSPPPPPAPNPGNAGPGPAPKPNGSGTNPPADYWFLNANAGATPPAGPGQATFPSHVVTPDEPAGPAQTSTPSPSQADLDEQALLEKLHAEKQKSQTLKRNYGHLRVIKPLAEQQAEAKAAAEEAAKKAAAKAAAAAQTPKTNPAILELANNDDLNVATIARQANKKAKGKKRPPDDEVVIKLH
jgi:hypothetical protein